MEINWCCDPATSNRFAFKEALRRHHQLIRTVKRTHFKNRIDTNAHNIKELFGIIQELSTPKACFNEPPPSQELCNSIASHFRQKIENIHNSFNSKSHQLTTNTLEPYAPRNTHLLHTWTPVNTEDTANTMATIYSGSPSDPCPHHIFNKANTIILPHLCHTINSSFESATFPERWKHAEINTLLKKPKADPDDPKNYRPISILPFPAKVIKKIVNNQLSRFLEDNKALNTSQSGFHKNHSTETALIAATDDIRTMLDKEETSALILLDLSAAFNTVCHHTLCTRLHNAGIRDKALDWISSFLTERTQRVRLLPFRSEASNITCGIPRGPSLSPTLFNMYMAPLGNIARKHHINIVSYANDTQLIISLTKDPTTAKDNLHNGLHARASWMESRHLRLNTDKTELLIFGTNPSAWNDSWWPTSLGSAPSPTTHACNLGFILDSTLSMTQQVNAISSSCYYTLRLLRRIFKWIPIETRKTVTHALVSNGLDYGNALYAGITNKLQTKLQRIQNASTRLILDIPRCDHISPHLRDLHWLPVSKRITFKILIHAHKTLYNTGPTYLNDRLTFHTPTRNLHSANHALAYIPRNPPHDHRR
ncbi:hypothetical protein NDU88_000564 [Pleurodeles waltl]|uniref:Reverse transcriptase domain-containing protein n=1 Tax=Pleurodeles waltl TaxID=8319 RepID=A0AAV7P5B8_PLEWA|nr:hypothetical protein NDU88_000564 [Pleurodeles waltl]